MNVLLLRVMYAERAFANRREHRFAASSGRNNCVETPSKTYGNGEAPKSCLGRLFHIMAWEEEMANRHEGEVEAADLTRGGRELKSCFQL